MFSLLPKFKPTPEKEVANGIREARIELRRLNGIQIPRLEKELDILQKKLQIAIQSKQTKGVQERIAREIQTKTTQLAQANSRVEKLNNQIVRYGQYEQNVKDAKTIKNEAELTSRLSIAALSPAKIMEHAQKLDVSREKVKMGQEAIEEALTPEIEDELMSGTAPSIDDIISTASQAVSKSQADLDRLLLLPTPPSHHQTSHTLPSIYSIPSSVPHPYPPSSPSFFQ